MPDFLLLNATLKKYSASNESGIKRQFFSIYFYIYTPDTRCVCVYVCGFVWTSPEFVHVCVCLLTFQPTPVLQEGVEGVGNTSVFFGGEKSRRKEERRKRLEAHRAFLFLDSFISALSFRHHHTFLKRRIKEEEHD